MNKCDLKELSIEEMEELATSLREKPYRGRQIFEWIFQKDAAETGEMTNLSIKFRSRLSESACITRLAIADKRISEDGTIKYLFMLDDGNSIESVLISESERLTLCISTQVGCKLNCSFCLTGKTGFVRNLKHSEIIEQILAVQREIRPPHNPLLQKEGNGVVKNITNIVLMGMGEPLDNYENVIKSIRTMVSPHGLKIPARKITVSTAGLIPEIISLAKENLKINLAVSLNAADNKIRDKIMPVNKRYPLDKLLEVLRGYPLSPGRRITFEYVMLKGINDTIDEAVSLSNILKGLRCKINLIPFNRITTPSSPPFEGGEKGEVKGGRGTHPVDGSGDFEPPPYKMVEDFQNFLISKNYTAIIRKSKGVDICAACGQLRSKLKNQNANIKIKESF